VRDAQLSRQRLHHGVALIAGLVQNQRILRCRNLYISQHFTGHLFRPWIPSSARDIDGGPRRFTEVVLNEQWINGFSTNIIHAIIWPSAL